MSYPCRTVDTAAAADDMTWNAEVSAFMAQRFAGFTDIAIPAFAIAYAFFFGIGGFLHVSTRLQDLLSKFCENCVYVSMVSHLHQPKIRNMCTNFSQPAVDRLEFNSK